MSLMQATLTLPGIAGIVLTMGDGRRRQRADLRAHARGAASRKDADAAIECGFTRAFATIIDSHLTTLLRASSSFGLASGPIRGFAVTLCIGIIASLFTAITLTRLILALGSHRAGQRGMGPALRLLSPHGIFSPTSRASTSFRTAHASLHARKGPVSGSLDRPHGRLAAAIGIARLQLRRRFQGRHADRGAVDSRSRRRAGLRDKLQASVSATCRSSPSAKDDVAIRVESSRAAKRSSRRRCRRWSRALGAGFEQRRVEVVGPAVSGELRRTGVIAVFGSLLAIFVYVWFRFDWQFALGAIVALAHDVLLVAGIFALFQLEFDLSIVAALLTVLGYSVNDTVVVSDRIRENLRSYKKMRYSTSCSTISINETLSRTILTGVTTIAVLLALCIFGGDVFSTSPCDAVRRHHRHLFVDLPRRPAPRLPRRQARLERHWHPGRRRQS